MTCSIAKTVIFTILVPGRVTVVIPRAMAYDATKPALYASTGFLPVAVGALIYFWCAWDFATEGRGTPAPIDAPRHIVVAGLYHFVRNPMYVGVLLVLTGESIVFQSSPLLTHAAIAFVFVRLFRLLLPRAGAQA